MIDKILELFEELFCVKYAGKIRIEEIPGGYTLVLGLNNPERPIRISALMNEEKFLEFIKKELLERHLEITEYYSGYKIDPIYD